MILFNSPQLERKEVPFRNAVWFKYLTQSINPWKPLNNLHSILTDFCKDSKLEKIDRT